MDGRCALEALSYMTGMQQMMGHKTSGKFLLREGVRNCAVPLGALFAASMMMGSASSPAHGAPSIPGRMGQAATLPVVLARDEDVTFSAANALNEIKRRSGVTWDQISQIVKVSRRRVHAWVAGEAITMEHQAKLEVLLEWVRARKDLKPFALKRQMLSEHGLAVPERRRLATSSEPVPTSDPRAFAGSDRIKKTSSRVRIARS